MNCYFIMCIFYPSNSLDWLSISALNICHRISYRPNCMIIFDRNTERGVKRWKIKYSPNLAKQILSTKNVFVWRNPLWRSPHACLGLTIPKMWNTRLITHMTDFSLIFEKIFRWWDKVFISIYVKIITKFIHRKDCISNSQYFKYFKYPT